MRGEYRELHVCTANKNKPLLDIPEKTMASDRKQMVYGVKSVFQLFSLYLLLNIQRAATTLVLYPKYTFKNLR